MQGHKGKTPRADRKQETLGGCAGFPEAEAKAKQGGENSLEGLV